MMASALEGRSEGVRSSVELSPIMADRVFLQQVLADLTRLEREVEIHYHGVLVRMLAAARRETEMLLSENLRTRPRSIEKPVERIG
jgi:hypothetical protein